MRFPIKLNRTNWPEYITKYLPSADDPRVLLQNPVDEVSFTKAISTFKFGTTFKSTQKARFPLTIMELASLTYQERPVILDVGASDGITSLDIMQSIPYEKYYVTDLNIKVFYLVSGNKTWFYDENNNCILLVSNKWVIYPDIGGAIFPFNRITHSIFAQAPKPEQQCPSIDLINPILQLRGNNIIVKKHNILEKWPHEKPELIIAANILNRSYFTPSEIETALKKLVAALELPAMMVIIDNRPVERSTIFQFNQGGFSILKKVNGGTEIESLAIKIFEGINFSVADNFCSEKV